MARVFVALGSNIDPETHLRQALLRLAELFGDLAQSSVYRSAAVGFDGPDFINLVVGFDTDDEPVDVHRALKFLEAELGRERTGERFASRTIDLDLLLYGDSVIDEAGLRVPSADVTRYAFVLVPLAEIAGSLRHPEIGRTFAELRDDIDDVGAQFVSVRPPSTLST